MMAVPEKERQQENDEPRIMSLEPNTRVMSFSVSSPLQRRSAVSAISSPISSRGRLRQVTDGLENLHSGVAAA